MPKEKVAKAKPGRPRNAVPAVVLSFRADPATVAAIDKIAATMPYVPSGAGGRSFAIRRAVLEVAAKLDAFVPGQ